MGLISSGPKSSSPWTVAATATYKIDSSPTKNRLEQGHFVDRSNELANQGQPSAYQLLGLAVNAIPAAPPRPATHSPLPDSVFLAARFRCSCSARRQNLRVSWLLVRLVSLLCCCFVFPTLLFVFPIPGAITFMFSRDSAVLPLPDSAILALVLRPRQNRTCGFMVDWFLCCCFAFPTSLASFSFLVGAMTCLFSTW